MPQVASIGEPESEATTGASRPTDFIDFHARRTGIDPLWLRKIMRVESGGRPSEVTGSYKGLFQLSNREFARHGGSGDIFDPEQNTMAAANKIAAEKTRFEQKHGRQANLADVYIIHQQGEAGYDAHLRNPDVVAWQNVRKYYSSDAMAKKAIWGNMTPAMKEKYGSVEKVTSADFIGDWSARIEGQSIGPISGKVAAARARRGGIPAEEPTEKKERAADLEPGFTPTGVTHVSVESPDIRMGGPVTAPQLRRRR